MVRVRAVRAFDRITAWGNLRNDCGDVYNAADETVVVRLLLQYYNIETALIQIKHKIIVIYTVLYAIAMII